MYSVAEKAERFAYLAGHGEFSTMWVGEVFLGNFDIHEEMHLNNLGVEEVGFYDSGSGEQSHVACEECQDVIYIPDYSIADRVNIEGYDYCRECALTTLWDEFFEMVVNDPSHAIPWSGEDVSKALYGAGFSPHGEKFMSGYGGITPQAVYGRFDWDDVVFVVNSADPFRVWFEVWLRSTDPESGEDCA